MNNIEMLDVSDFQGLYRTIDFTRAVDTESCSMLLAKVQEFLAENPTEMITILLSSDGGYLNEAFAIYDILRHARKTCIVRVICYGKAFSAGALILACGSIGYRYAYPSSTAMVHGVQLEGLVHGHIKTTTLPLVQNALNDYKRFIDYFAYEILKKVNDEGKEYIENKDDLAVMSEYLMNMMNQDTYLDADAMLEMGLIDQIGIPELEYAEELTQNDLVQEEAAEDKILFDSPAYKSDAEESNKWNLIDVAPQTSASFIKKIKELSDSTKQARTKIYIKAMEEINNRKQGELNG